MEARKAMELLEGALRDIRDTNGFARTDDFSSLRQVDAKVREVKLVLQGTPEIPQSLHDEMNRDDNFVANSRRVRLETLAHYCETAIRFLKQGAFKSDKKQILAPPDFSKLTRVMPNLEEAIARRWREAQKCQHIGCYTSAIILMGSVLEGLLLCRASSDPQASYTSSRAPKGRDGKPVPIQDWNLNALIDVAVERKWIKSDRGAFSHALRESRNVVHPWVEITTHANFDEATCKTSWEVLKASTQDLLQSVS